MHRDSVLPLRVSELLLRLRVDEDRVRLGRPAGIVVVDLSLAEGLSLELSVAYLALYLPVLL